MNCIDIRRVLNTGLNSQDAEFQRHRRECPQCAASVSRAAQFERRLKSAMNVEVPEHLASRILLKKSFLGRRNAIRRREQWFGIAASVVLTSMLITWFVLPNWSSVPGEEVIAITDDDVTALPPAAEGAKSNEEDAEQAAGATGDADAVPESVENPVNNEAVDEAVECTDDLCKTILRRPILNQILPAAGTLQQAALSN